MKKTLLLFALCAFLTTATAQNALSFDGVNDYVSCTQGGPSGSANRTVECWIKTSNSISTQQILVDWGQMTTGSRFTLNLINFGKLRIEVGGNGFNSTQSIADGTWHHVAITYDNSAALKFKMYIDGQLEANQNTTVAVNTSATGGFQIGRRNDMVNYYQGAIDEIRVWDVVRTQTEIQNAMNAEFCSIPPNLVAYFKCNQGVAGGNNAGQTTLTNALGSNNGTLSGFALGGSSSNWVTGKSLATGSTSPGNANITACDSYTAGNGAVWTTSGNYVDTITSTTGCDSIVNIALTILQSSTGSLTTTACNKYVSPSGNNTWTVSGTYTDVLTNAAGCDSVLTINLTINTVDTSVFQNGKTLTAWATNANYQWLDCNAGYTSISGATNQTFTATANGSYAVAIDKNGCIDTSACYTVTGIGLAEYTDLGLKIYPNPTCDLMHLSIANPQKVTRIALRNALGQTVFSANAWVSEIDLSKYAAGIYLLQIATENGIWQEKVEKR